MMAMMVTREDIYHDHDDCNETLGSNFSCLANICYKHQCQSIVALGE